MKFKAIINWFLIPLFFISFTFLGYNIIQLKADKNIALSSVETPLHELTSENAQDSIAVRNWNIAELSIGATSVMSSAANLVDSQGDQVLFAKNIQEKLPIASLTKLMTAMIALDNYDLSDEVMIDRPDLSWGNSQSVSNLLHLMLIASNNDSAVALASRVGENNFVWLMNQKAKYIGLQNTHFEDPTGLSENNYSTAEDLSKFAIYIVKNYPKIVQISEIKEIELPKIGKVESTNKLLGKVPGIVIGKTGFTIDAKECLLLMIYNPQAKNYLVHIILGSDDRFSDMQKLIDWVYYAYRWQK